MARGRMINQSVATDKRLNSISEEAELAFLKTIPHLDRDGLIIGDATLLAAKICPRRPQLAAKMDTIIQEWIGAELVVAYVPGEDPVLYFPGFTKNQIGLRYDREPASIYPPPPGYYRNGNGVEPLTDEPAPHSPTTNGSNPQPSGNLPADIRQPSGTLPPEVEVEVKEKTTLPCAREATPAEQPNNGGGGSASLLEPPKPPNRQTDSEYAKVCNAIESNGFGFMTPFLAEEVGELLNEFPLQWILDSMRVAVEANKRQIRYCRGILRKWRADGRDPAQSPVTQAQPPPSQPEAFVMPAAAKALRERLQSLSPQ